MAKTPVMSVYFKSSMGRSPVIPGGHTLSAANRIQTSTLQQLDNSALKPTLGQVLFWLVPLLFLGVSLCVTPGYAEKAVPESRPAGIIVLDPGHGGNDMGVMGSEGILEKQVVHDGCRSHNRTA